MEVAVHYWMIGALWSECSGNTSNSIIMILNRNCQTSILKTGEGYNRIRRYKVEGERKEMIGMEEGETNEDKGSLGDFC